MIAHRCGLSKASYVNDLPPKFENLQQQMTDTDTDSLLLWIVITSSLSRVMYKLSSIVTLNKEGNSPHMNRTWKQQRKENLKHETWRITLKGWRWSWRVHHWMGMDRRGARSCGKPISYESDHLKSNLVTSCPETHFSQSWAKKKGSTTSSQDPKIFCFKGVFTKTELDHREFNLCSSCSKSDPITSRLENNFPQSELQDSESSSHITAPQETKSNRCLSNLYTSSSADLMGGSWLSVQSLWHFSSNSTGSRNQFASDHSFNKGHFLSSLFVFENQLWSFFLLNKPRETAHSVGGKGAIRNTEVSWEA